MLIFGAFSGMTVCVTPWQVRLPHFKLDASWSTHAKRFTSFTQGQYRSVTYFLVDRHTITQPSAKTRGHA